MYPSWSVCKILLDLEDRDFKAFREILRALTKFWNIRTGIGIIRILVGMCEKIHEIWRIEILRRLERF